MTASAVSPLIPANCPAPLRALPGFLVWRYEANPGGGKPRKVPYYANGSRRTGRQGSPDDVQQLATFAEAKAAAIKRGMDGVGFAPLREFGVTALDFDNCMVQGAPHPDLAPVISSTYAERSPSGNGIRAFYQGDLGDRKSHGGPYGFETFSGKGYVTITGQVLDSVHLLGNADEVAPIPDDVMALVRSRFKREATTQDNTPNPEALGLDQATIDLALSKLPTDLDYDTWITVGMALHHEGAPFEVWDQWSQHSPKYTTSEYNAERWRSFGKHQDSTVTMRTVMHMAGLGHSAVASAEDFEVLTSAPAAPNAKPLRFQVQSAAEFANGPAPRWLIKGVLPEAELVVLYGASGSGKSFLALDMAASLARGLPWRTKRTRQVPVVYVAAEGAGGFRNRMQAYCVNAGIQLDDLDIGVVHAAPNLLERQDAIDLVKAIKAWGEPRLIIIDTLAQVTPGGNENAGEDMGKVLTHCKRIRERTGAVIMLVHHSGKDAAKGARGWSGLKAAADAELEVVREATGRRIKVSKQKDGEDGLEWGFALDTVSLGVDEDGDQVGSCVVVDAALPAVGGTPCRVLGPVETLVNEAIQEIAKVQTTGIEVRAVIESVIAKMTAPEGKRDTRRQHAQRALKTLCADDFSPYEVEDGCISIL